RPGMEIWQCYETSPYGAALRDAKTGEFIFKWDGPKDTGRACTADLDPRYPGEEMWAARSQLFSSDGKEIGGAPEPCNFVIWWDGDLLRELLDHYYNKKSDVGVGSISKWDYKNDDYTKLQMRNLLTANGTYSNNSTKGNPGLQADIYGDWREEVIWRVEDSSALRIYTTTDPTEYRIYTLMHDPAYRLAVAWQNTVYNQPPHVGFFLGDGMAAPPKPNIFLTP
ncbi:MAG TPA: hypothetical protein VEC37_12710, partial [Bacillota bacterium]|nr:hypothetical protein [Bacillota bacterium]